MNTIKALKEQMLEVSAKHELPLYYKTDIEEDFRVMDSYTGKPFLWLLRTHGTQILPIEIGADPCFITHWLEQDSVVVFLVHPVDGTISKITDAKALTLAHLPPPKFKPYSTPSTIVEKVTGVLDYGLSKSVWGMFDSPQMPTSPDHWQQWVGYFKTCGNEVMALYMEEAIRKLSNTKQRSAA